MQGAVGHCTRAPSSSLLCLPCQGILLPLAHAWKNNYFEPVSKKKGELTTKSRPAKSGASLQHLLGKVRTGRGDKAARIASRVPGKGQTCLQRDPGAAGEPRCSLTHTRPSCLCLPSSPALLPAERNTSCQVFGVTAQLLPDQPSPSHS